MTCHFLKPMKKKGELIKIGDKVRILEVGKYYECEGEVFDIIDGEYWIDAERYHEPKLVITKQVKRLK